MQYDFENKPRRSFFGLGFWIIVIIAGLSMIGGVISIGGNLLSQPGRVIQQTFDANNMIYNYEWFRQQYQDVDAMKIKISNSEAQLQSWLANAPERSTWKIQDSQTYSQLNSIVLGQKNQLAQMIANYNSRSSMANRSIFMNGLPSQISN
jgi:hypothetical protein